MSASPLKTDTQTPYSSDALMAILAPVLSQLRGRIAQNAPLGATGWLRAGGAADVLFKPVDQEDLALFLSALPPDAPLNIFGVLSNTIVRDGGLRGVTIKLGKAFTQVEDIGDGQMKAGAMVLDGTLAMAASRAGVSGLEFFSGIPGTIGGALRMNAGCYGTETKDVLVQATAMDRGGALHVLTPAQMGMRYRHTDTPADYIFLDAIFQGTQGGDPESIRAFMDEIKQKRQDSQPIREKTGGSTFANPETSEIAAAGLPEGTKVWQLIDKAGCRGLQIGGAQMSEKHCNFMINTGNASGADLENLGEEVRKRVYERSGITLRWEVRRVGEHIS
jgi:UDP-N-acetylmuramate dehydrogenase